MALAARESRCSRIDSTPHIAFGSVHLVVDVQTGAIAQQLAYDAFGQVIEDTSPGFQPFGFAGGLYDVETGSCTQLFRKPVGVGI
jgi:YD repeat-containing protein